MENVIFTILFAIGTLFAAFAGALMAALPSKYVEWSNWWLAKTGHSRVLSLDEFSRWSRRLSGIILFALSAFVFVFAIVRKLIAY